MSVGLDTMILIWGLQRPHHKAKRTKQNVAEMQRRSRILLNELSASKEIIIAPTVAISELLCGVERKDHGPLVAEIQKQFFCPPFDLQACAMAADLWQFHETWPKDQQFQDRPLLRADVMIVATARTAGAYKFYSHDPKLRKLVAHAGMMASDLPTHSQNFFTDSEIEDYPSATQP